MTGTRRRPIRGWQRALAWLLAGYAVVGIIGSLLTLTLVRQTAPYSSDLDAGLSAITDDVADSWSRFNEGVDKAPPAWDADDFRRAVGAADGGDVVRLPGSEVADGGTLLDAAAVRKTVSGSNILVVVTPPSPLGAIETTRVRDNTMQQQWAAQRHLQLIMVHGQQVYLPGPDLYIITSPESGIPLREAMRTGDVTPAVISVAQQSLADQAGDDDHSTPDPPGAAASDAKALAFNDSRAPRPAELAPITAALDAGQLYVGPGVTPVPRFNPDWSKVAPGKELKVVILPFAPAGTAVDYTTALAAKYPTAAVLVMTGKWIESAGIDRDTMVAALQQTYGLGGFAMAASAPAYPQILDWVTGIDAAATASNAFHRPLPAMPDTSIPRWVSYLVLATSLLLALGFAGGYLLARRRRSSAAAPRRWLEQVTAGLTTSYLALAAAPGMAGPGGVAGGDDPSWRARQTVDDAYADLLELRGLDAEADRPAVTAAVNSAWTLLDDAAGLLGRPEAGPSATLPAKIRIPPRAAADRAGRPEVPWWQQLSASIRRRKQRRRERPAPGLLRSLGRQLAIVTVVGVLALGAVMLWFTTVGLPGTGKDYDTSAFDTSNVWIGAPSAAAGSGELQRVIGDRALLVAVRDDTGMTKMDGVGLADDIAAAHPQAVAFVIADGQVLSAGIGGDIRVGGYDDYSLIDDYYGLQGPAAGNNTALVRQLALLYDRLSTEHSIKALTRSAYDPPAAPWVLIAVLLVLATVGAGFLIRFTARRFAVRAEVDDDSDARREALRLRLSEAADRLLRAPPDGAGVGTLSALETERRGLDQQIGRAAASQFDDLERRVDAFVHRVRLSVG